MVKRHGPQDLIPPEIVRIDTLKPHPRNYKDHPHDQIEHLGASLEQFGQTRNVVIARDNTILAGHGIVEAAWLINWETIEVRRMNLDPDSPDALKLLALDNETARFAVNDDRALTELLREISEQATAGLLGTGYDEMMLANLAMVTRTAAELASFDNAAEWVGMPDYDPEDKRFRLIILFDTHELRARFLDEHRLWEAITKAGATERPVFSAVWPPVEGVRNDGGLRYVPDTEPDGPS